MITAPEEITALNIENEPGWKRLRLFNYYRSALALLFLTLYLNGWTEFLVRPEVFFENVYFLAAIGYLVISIVFMLTIYQEAPHLELQLKAQVCFDILFILALMHATGGIRSGLGTLLIVNISFTSLFLPLRATMMFAAITTIALIITQSYTYLTVTAVQPLFTQVGLLGLVLFGFAFFTSTVATRLRQTEVLARETSEELESAVQMSEHIISSMRTGILVLTPDGRIEMANNAAKNLLSDAYISDKSQLSDVSPRLFERFVEWQFDHVTNSQKPIQQSHGLPDIQPGFSNIEPHKGKEARTLIFIEDASQLNQRFQQVKLASLGRLTASIAHEIRNPLAAIHHAAQLLSESDLFAGDAKLTEIINTQVNRLNTIVENVLQISRQQRGTAEEIRLHDWMINFHEEFCNSKQLPDDQVRIRIEPRDTRILFDASQLHQVIWNLCSNALTHSGLDLENVVITIEGGRSVDIDQPYIDIIDNGVGIDPDVAQQIFEPFYTTSSSGTGLGLYITKEVIESNRAKISYIPMPTGGTCFRIYFIHKPTQESTQD